MLGIGSFSESCWCRFLAKYSLNSSVFCSSNVILVSYIICSGCLNLVVSIHFLLKLKDNAA